MDKNYRALSILSVFMSLLGLFLIAIGIYFSIYEGLVEPRVAGHPFRERDLIELSAGLLALFFGTVALIVSECIKVLLGIEKNTRRSEENTRRLVGKVPPPREPKPYGEQGV
jgi:formate-dependent nitrite reductase membrane component NrfD